MSLINNLLSVFGIGGSKENILKLDVALGDATALRLRAELAFGDYRATQRFLETCRNYEDRWFYIDALTVWPGRPRWLDSWVEKEMKSPIPWLVRGVHTIRWAWDAQGANKAGVVNENDKAIFIERLQKAEHDLQMAIWLDNEDPTPWAYLLKTGLGLQIRSKELELRFNEACQRDAEHRQAHALMLQTLCEKWGGLHQIMFDFARKTIAKASEGSSLHTIIADAHIERWLYHLLENDNAGAQAYFRGPGVGKEIAAAAIHSLYSINYKRTKLTSYYHNIFAFCFWLIGNDNLARREFQAIDKAVCEFPWCYLGEPIAEFTRARKECLDKSKPH
jgi:hypothetical protein